ncbi:hypothetical protein DL766_009343 [Monosporascus sp. MC13-8B]|uniref:chitinase n=1 Tax=Monosporascus cannonballus TaxID=155416 RepID=A0ABY0GTG1_9PEZI|nr:hypothetical protein DL762_009408 [Monosporascus cannonballus]RYO78798.1 hypothetical protein DL763_009511 [Monosporascus cannonballus]RYP15687.1 hypothetical protein DL766_009343 [Monosporascus sp. MC13-8B]
MNRLLSSSLLLLSAAIGLASPIKHTSDVDFVKKRSLGFQNAVYFTNWAIYARDYQPAQLPVSQVNRVHYAFLNLQEDGTVFSGDTFADLEKHYPGDAWNETGTNAYGCVKQIFKLKKANRHLKTVLSIGGWTLSTNFTAVATSPSARANFAKTAVKIMGDWGMDGIDVDWEYPASSADGENYVKLLDAVRAELDRYAEKYAPGYHFLLTAATPAGSQHYNNMNLPEASKRLDYLYLMAYDYAGSWDNKTGYLDNLYPSIKNPAATPFSTEKALNDYFDFGIPSEKILLGMPVYGRAFENTDGPGKPYRGVGNGSWEAGVYDYKVLPQPGAEEFHDEQVGATYSYDSAKRRMVSYDTPDMVREKVGYLQSRGLAGSMFWEASGDKTGAGSLIGTAFDAQGGSAWLDSCQNLLSYPGSAYDNIRKGLN